MISFVLDIFINHKISLFSFLGIYFGKYYKLLISAMSSKSMALLLLSICVKVLPGTT